MGGPTEKFISALHTPLVSSCTKILRANERIRLPRCCWPSGSLLFSALTALEIAQHAPRCHLVTAPPFPAQLAAFGVRRLERPPFSGRQEHKQGMQESGRTGKGRSRERLRCALQSWLHRKEHCTAGSTAAGSVDSDERVGDASVPVDEHRGTISWHTQSVPMNA